MHVETAGSNTQSFSTPFLAGYENSTQNVPDRPRMVRSVVEAAGLGRFVYLEGASGKRYVFSSIRAEQVSLYDHALFAATSVGGDAVRVSDDFSKLKSAGLMYYVHLLDDDDVLADLNIVAA